MRGRAYVNADGSLRRAARAASAHRRGVDEQRVASLLAAVREQGYVIVPERNIHVVRSKRVGAPGTPLAVDQKWGR